MSRYHYDIRVALHLKTGQIAGPEPYRDLCGRRLPRLHGKAKTPVEGGIQAAVIPRLDLVHLTHTESMPSGSRAWIDPEMESCGAGGLIDRTVVRSKVKLSRGGAGRSRSSMQPATIIAASKISVRGIWRVAFREMRSVLPSCRQSQQGGQSDLPRAIGLHRDSFPGLDRLLPSRGAPRVAPSREYPASPSRIP